EASSVAEASFTLKALPVVATPAFSIAGGAVDAGTVVTLSCTTEGTAIYYTVDGSEPTSESTLYAEGIVIDRAMTVKAIALKEGWEASSVAEASFTLKALPVVTTPAFSVAGGAVDAGTVVTLSCATEGAAIHYTVDGSAPTSESTLYAEGIVIDKAMTVKAIALKEGWEASSVAEASFTLKAKPTDPTANESALSAAPIAYVQGRTAYLADGLGEVEAFTMAGQRVYSGSDRTITLPRPGIYVLRVVADGRRCKVIVK
ncbi:MAG: chitobiase/beta-hexosaminidase C-terminal domain-containing protein, partial [Bacteroidales bacterium]|nr:chitobiase/beta-hexosaminidase C-terminal domain-containing protein [Bacteroidales bacterium]